MVSAEENLFDFDSEPSYNLKYDGTDIFENADFGTPIIFTFTFELQVNGCMELIPISRYHSLTFMKEYQQKSVEELRWEDYQVSRKGKHYYSFDYYTVFGLNNVRPIFWRSSLPFLPTTDLVMVSDLPQANKEGHQLKIIKERSALTINKEPRQRKKYFEIEKNVCFWEKSPFYTFYEKAQKNEEATAKNYRMDQDFGSRCNLSVEEIGITNNNNNNCGDGKEKNKNARWTNTRRKSPSSVKRDSIDWRRFCPYSKEYRGFFSRRKSGFGKDFSDSHCSICTFIVVRHHQDRLRENLTSERE